MTRHASPSDAVACIQSGQRVFIHGAAATPSFLVDALVAQAGRLRDVELIHLVRDGPLPVISGPIPRRVPPRPLRRNHRPCRCG
jgi:hypothetical protein